MKTSIGILLSFTVLLVSCMENTRIANTAANDTDGHFMIQAAYASMSLSETAGLAAQKAENEPLKTLVNELNMDYKNAYDELKAISSDLNYPIPVKVNRQHLEEELTLLALYGKEFDTAYIGRQIRNNLNIIDLLETEANGGHDLFLRRYAMKYLPVMKQHVYRADSVLELINSRKYNMAIALKEQ